MFSLLQQYTFHQYALQYLVVQVPGVSHHMVLLELGAGSNLSTSNKKAHVLLKNVCYFLQKSGQCGLLH